MNDNDVRINNEDTMKDLYLIFTVNKRDYALDVHYLIEIIAIQPLSEIDNMPEYVKGVINLRGKIIPIIDVRLRLKLPTKEYSEFTCVLIVKLGELFFGMVVDAVQELIHIPEENKEPTPTFLVTNKTWCIDYIGKLEKDIKMILNLDKFLHWNEVEKLQTTELV
ncbi:MAG: purine-binding chemotaxis protein CheW [Leptospiraceae bacterium]|nr:purine-binding chemotaxis protein CheW [Leptospiraceae bacterium]